MISLRGVAMEVSLPCAVYLAMVVTLLTFPSTLCASTSPISFHEEYCQAIADESGHQDDSSSRNSSGSFLGFRRAFFTGGSPFFDANATVVSFRRSYKSAFLAIRNTTSTSSEQERPRTVVDASLLLRNRSRLFREDRPRAFRHARDPFLRPGGVRFILKGLWSPHSGTLCMTGCIIQDYRRQSDANDCELKAFFRYPLISTIHQPLVRGTIQSMRDVSDPLFFDPMYITAVYEAPFVFENDGEIRDLAATMHPNVPQHVNVWKADNAVCEFPWFKQPLTIAWDKQCTGQDCSPFKGVGRTTSLALTAENMICSGGKVHGFLIFDYGPSKPVESRFSSLYDVLAIEGIWSPLTGQLNALGCYLEGITNSSLEFDSKDCDIVITLQFPITLKLTFRYSIMGRVERKLGSTLTGFKPFLFTGHLDMSYGSIGWERGPPQLEYAYTAEKIFQANSKCQSSSPGELMKSKIVKKKLAYPDGQNFADLGVPAFFKVSSSSYLDAQSQFSPVSINDKTNTEFTPSSEIVASSMTSQKKVSLNVSFDIKIYDFGHGVKFLLNTTSNRLPAEGVYDPNTGLLCLRACRSLVVSNSQLTSNLYDGDKDCEMHITIRFPPINPGYFDKQHVSGQLSSLRDPKDALFFSPVDITSGPIFYQSQAANALIQINFEAVMGMISLTMSVLFIGFQLHHVKKYPKALPQISLLMLSTLVLGHLIPLVLNFEAVFRSAYAQNIVLLSGRSLEINEVILRLMTMVVFLMLIRLLYLSWMSKCESTASEGPWDREKKHFWVSLTTYGLAGLISLIVYGVKGSNFLNILKGLSGLILDFFLFPQMVGNYMWEIHDTILSCSFIMGMTFVRTSPHVYDIVRRLDFFGIGDAGYYFANTSWDFYSNVWDAVIMGGGLTLAILVFCQQRYGGALFYPAFWRQRRYKQVSMNPV